MKNIKIFTILMVGVMSLTIVSCKKDLPYPIDEVKRGALIDIYPLEGSDANISLSAVNLGFKLQMVKEGAGEYSKIQWTCLYYNPSTEAEKYIICQDNITTLPQNVNVDLAALQTALGITLAADDELYFTTNVVLKDNSVVYGYNVHTGAFNNANFTGYAVDGRTYSRYCAYKVVP